MRSWQSPSYVLDPGGTFAPDPGGCWHCAHNPGYTHRHWVRKREAEPAAPGHRDGPAWRFLYWVYSDWGIGRRRDRASGGPGS